MLAIEPPFASRRLTFWPGPAHDAGLHKIVTSVLSLMGVQGERAKMIANRSTPVIYGVLRYETFSRNTWSAFGHTPADSDLRDIAEWGPDPSWYWESVSESPFDVERAVVFSTIAMIYAARLGTLQSMSLLPGASGASLFVGNVADREAAQKHFPAIAWSPAHLRGEDDPENKTHYDTMTDLQSKAMSVIALGVAAENLYQSERGSLTRRDVAGMIWKAMDATRSESETDPYAVLPQVVIVHGTMRAVLDGDMDLRDILSAAGVQAGVGYMLPGEQTESRLHPRREMDRNDDMLTFQSRHIMGAKVRSSYPNVVHMIDASLLEFYQFRRDPLLSEHDEASGKEVASNLGMMLPTEDANPYTQFVLDSNKRYRNMKAYLGRLDADSQVVTDYNLFRDIVLKCRKSEDADRDVIDSLPVFIFKWAPSDRYAGSPANMLGGLPGGGKLFFKNPTRLSALIGTGRASGRSNFGPGPSLIIATDPEVLDMVMHRSVPLTWRIDAMKAYFARNAD